MNIPLSTAQNYIRISNEISYLLSASTQSLSISFSALISYVKIRLNTAKLVLCCWAEHVIQKQNDSKVNPQVVNVQKFCKAMAEYSC